MRFFGGLIVGLLALGAYVGYERWQTDQDPCRGRCGEGTRCAAGTCIAEITDSKPRKKRRRRGKRRRRRKRPGAATESGTQLKPVSAADQRPASSGPTLRGTDYIKMDETSGGEGELSEATVEQSFRRLDPRIIACIDRARDGYALDAGRVVVGFRIERSGAVNKVKVTAPALMQRQGLYKCIAPMVRALRFPRSGRSLIMTFPYRLD